MLSVIENLPNSNRMLIILSLLVTLTSKSGNKKKVCDEFYLTLLILQVAWNEPRRLHVCKENDVCFTTGSCNRLGKKSRR